MRSKIFFAILTVLSLVWSAWTIAGAQAQQQSVDAELQKFQGTWMMISAEMDGKKVNDAHVKQSRITFVGDKVELIAPHQHKDTIVASVVKLDCTKNPKEMHWVRTAGPNAGKTMIAIYEFEGPDQYKICFDPASLVVPKEFGTKAGSGHIWHTWKRAKQ
ncbi:MAG: TIGR03067 domain-containing protein [Deltaproteobacteria bacterium]|nr:TIGR03067 domain-containing protein [Deltaproteobacteria bacterium]